MAKYKKDILKIYLVAGLSLLLLTLSFYQLGFKPLYERLRHEYSQESRYFLDSGLWVLQSIFNKHHELASQTASRTATREKQIDYLKQKITQQELVSFSKVKLADAVNANSDILGIIRRGPTGNILYRVGFTYYTDIEKYCVNRPPDQTRFAGLITMKERRVLIYCSPIRDIEYGHVGTDVLIVKEDNIQRIINTHHLSKDDSMLLAIVSDHQILYWPKNIQDPQAREALGHYITGASFNSDYIFRSRALDHANWQLVAAINEKRFFSTLDQQQLILVLVITGITLVVFILTVLALKPIIKMLLQEQLLYEKAHHDGLTGLYNHARLLELLDRELGLAARHDNKLSVIMFDIDHFKQVNDRHGHQAGDEVLQGISKIIRELARSSDVSARYGGEEFVIILPQTDIEGATAMAERMRTRIAETPTPFEGRLIKVTISLGVVCCDLSKIRCNTPELIKTVDEALYTSKREGRNRTTSARLPAACE